MSTQHITMQNTTRRSSLQNVRSNLVNIYEAPERRFRLGKEIYSSAKGVKVVQAIDVVTFKKVVVKKVSRNCSANILNQLDNEVRILKKLKDIAAQVGIQQYVTSYRTKTDYCVVTIQSGTDLMTEILDNGILAESSVLRILKDVGKTLHDLHENCGYAHRDIKGDNICYSPSTGKFTLIDFGHSVPVTFTKGRAGTRPYAPPEVGSEESFDPKRVDMYELGVTAYTLLTGNFPFKQYREPLDTVRAIQRVNCSDALREILTGLMEPDFRRRWDVTLLSQQAVYSA